MKLRNPFRRRKPDERFVYQELVLVHMHGISEAHAQPLEEALQPLLNQLHETGSSGTDEEGAEATLYISTDDARATLAHLLPFLRNHPLSRNADITLQTRIPGGHSYEVAHHRFHIQSEQATAATQAPQGELHG